MLLSLVLYVLSLVGVVLGARILMSGWRALSKRLALRPRARFGTLVFAESKRPVYWVFLFLGIYLVTRVFYAQPLLAGNAVKPFLDDAFFTVITLAIAHLALSAVRASLSWYQGEMIQRQSSHLDDAFLHLAVSLAKVVIYFVAGTMILARFGITITSLLATAGVASLAVAFAAQETLGNMLAGFTIMIDRPFRSGDRIELADGSMGDVVDIGLRSTKVLSFENTLIVIPNKEIAGAKVVNHSYPDHKAKVSVEIGVAYESDIDSVKRILQDVLQGHPKVLNEPAVATFFTCFGESALQVLAVGWIADYRDRYPVLDQLNTEIKRRFDSEGVIIPYQQRTIHIAKDG